MVTRLPLAEKTSVFESRGVRRKKKKDVKCVIKYQIREYSSVVEQLTLNQSVVGSIPSTPLINVCLYRKSTAIGEVASVAN